MDCGLTIDDLKAELKAVRQARMDLYAAGQSYNRPGLSLMRANLDSLAKREQQILSMMLKMSDGIAAVNDTTSNNVGGPRSDADFLDSEAS